MFLQSEELLSSLSGSLGGFSVLGLESGLCGSLFGGELLCTLLSDSLTLETVLLSLSLETLLGVISCCCIILSLDGCYFLVTSGLPGVETLLCLCLVESTLLDTAAEMLHQHHALFREKRTYCVCGLRTLFYPIQSTVEV